MMSSGFHDESMCISFTPWYLIYVTFLRFMLFASVSLADGTDCCGFGEYSSLTGQLTVLRRNPTIISGNGTYLCSI